MGYVMYHFVLSTILNRFLVVDFDLRSPSMLHGKKGFDRLVYACKNALSQPTTWLFCNLSKSESYWPCIWPDANNATAPSPDPLLEYFPTRYSSPFTTTDNINVLIPPLKPPPSILESGYHLDMEEYSTDTYEWLSLVRLSSPRVSPRDKIDSYLANYTVPGNLDEVHEGKLCKISWEGFIPPDWTRQLLANVILALSAKSWFALSSQSFSKDTAGSSNECTILRPPNAHGEYFLWDIKD
jgi:ribonucleases P/MRP protein subunit RPP40